MVASVLQVVSAHSSATAASIDSPSMTAAASSYLHMAVTFGSTTDAVSSVTDTQGLTWTSAGHIADTVNLQSIKHYTSSVTSSGSVVVTVNFDPTESYRGIVVKEIGESSGADAGINSENYQANPIADADAVTSLATGTLSAQPALVSGACFNSSGVGVPTTGTGFTSDGTGWGFATGAEGRWENKRVTSTTGVAALFTAPAANEDCLSVVAIFTEGVPPPPPRIIHPTRAVSMR